MSALWALASVSSARLSASRTIPTSKSLAVSDLIPERCAGLAKACRCEKTYPSLEEMVKDDKIEAVFVATDAPSHARHCIEVLLARQTRGLRGARCVRLTRGSRSALSRPSRSSGLKYMMFETTVFHDDLLRHAAALQCRQIRQNRLFRGRVLTTTRTSRSTPTRGGASACRPQWYPTHSNAYYVGVAGWQLHRGLLHGHAQRHEHLQPANNRVQESFWHRDRPFRTSEGGMSRMASAGTPPASAARWAGSAASGRLP